MDMIAGNFSGGLNYFTAFSKPAVVPAISESPIHPSICLSVYPNPANDIVTVSLSGLPPSEDLHLGLFDLTGRQVLSTNFRMETKLNTASLSEGFYIIKVMRLEGRVSCSSLVVIH
jgi:hypothetical protein